MPPNAKVIIFEDDRDSVEILTNSLIESGHTVLFIAETVLALETALTTTTHADVALLDNQAPWKPGEPPDDRGVGLIAQNLVQKRFGNDTTIVATTSNERSNYGDFKFQGHLAEIGTYVTALPRKES